MRGGTRRGGALLASPLFAASIGLLVLNDHVLKPTWPGIVTGKLSDVAGVTMVAIAAIAVLRRIGIAVGLTALAFTALKTVSVVAEWAAPVLGGVTLTDPTDLLALVVLPPIWRWARSRHDRPPADDADWELPVRFALIGAAVFATTATSCAGEGVLRLGIDGRRIYADTSAGVFASDDGGASWHGTGRSSWDAEFDEIDFRVAGGCDGGDVCVEIRRSSDTQPSEWIIEAVSPGGDERLLTLNADELRSLDDLLGRTCEGIAPNDAAAVDGSEGRHVVVAMGEAGALHGSPDGSWEWVAVGEFGFDEAGGAAGVLDFDVASTPELGFWERNSWPGTTALLLVPALMAAFVVPIRQLGRRRKRDPVVATVLCVVAAIGLAVLSFGVLWLTGVFDNEGARAPAALVLVVAAVVIGSILVLVELRPGPEPPGRIESPPNPDERVG